MITYNHSAYIQEAVESVLAQATNFPVELVIGEDASTDNTAEIIQRYMINSAIQIRARCNRVNLGMQRNFAQTLSECKGEYVALLEGDDFWTDPRKLQVQVEFLEHHKDFVMCAHAVTVMDENGHKAARWTPYYPLTRSVNGFSDILENHFIPTLSLVFRRETIDAMPEWLCKVRSPDIALELMLASHGKCFYFKKRMGVYRRHPGGVTSVRVSPADLRTMEYALYDGINTYTKQEYERKIRRKIAMVDCVCAFRQVRSLDYGNGLKTLVAAHRKDWLVVVRFALSRIRWVVAIVGLSVARLLRVSPIDN